MMRSGGGHLERAFRVRLTANVGQVDRQGSARGEIGASARRLLERRERGLGARHGCGIGSIRLLKQSLEQARDGGRVERRHQSVSSSCDQVRRSSDAARFTNPALLPNLVDARPSWRRHLPLAVFLVALTAMIVGVARPRATVSVPREEATVLIAIDASLSMQARDVQPSRLAVAQEAAKAFIAEIPKKFRIGLVSFTGRPFVILPPTQDRVLAAHAGRIDLRRIAGADHFFVGREDEVAEAVTDALRSVA